MQGNMETWERYLNYIYYVNIGQYTARSTPYNMFNLLVMLDGEVRSRGQNLGSEVKTKGKTSRKITEKTIRKTIEKRVRRRPREVVNINLLQG